MHLSPEDSVLLDGLLPAAACRERLARGALAAPAWEEVVARADGHLTAPLLRFNLAAAGRLPGVPAEARRRLDEIARVWAARHLAYVSEARRLLGALAAAGIEAIPLKGAALMLGAYYPQPGLRGALDLDLLVAPAQLAAAEAVAEACGYREIPGRRAARPQSRLENERNHSWPRRGAGGLLLELHHRAFHFARGGRDLTFAELRAGAIARDGLLHPAPSDLALHLIHHTIVDLQSTHAILRTLADLHVLFAAAPEARDQARARAADFGFAGAADLAAAALQTLVDAPGAAAASADVALLLDTALLPDADELAETARWFEYFDLRRRPLRKLAALASLLFTSRAHLEQLYGPAEPRSLYLNYLRRPLDLLRKIRPASLSLANLRRVRALRRASGR